MNTALRNHLVKTFGMAQDADEATAKALVSTKLMSGELSADTFATLLNTPAEGGMKDKAGELAESIATKTATALAPAMTAQTAALTQLAEVLKSRGEAVAQIAPAATLQQTEEEDFEKVAAAMEARLAKKFGFDKPAGNDGDSLMKMAYDEASEDGVRVKGVMERYAHQPQVMVYKSRNAKTLGIAGEAMRYNGKEVHKETERTQEMSAVWFKLQLFPEHLNEREKEMVRWILHKEKFSVPDGKNTSTRLLTEHERQLCWDGHKNFYARNMKAAVVDDTGTGGEYAIPEYFDMDMIVAPTLAGEDIPSYCHTIVVPRGSGANNFILGRPTIAAAQETTTSGTPTAVFNPTGFITNHDTEFFRAAGFIELGRNFESDAHPRLVEEIRNQYMNSVKLWLNTQITTGDGTTEPQGIMNASGTNNVTPTTPTTGPILLADALEMLFAVNKAYRLDGGRQNAIYIGTDLTYGRIRSIATGVTGDTRLVFGDDVESYRLFGHPYLVEEGGMQNDWLIFAQMKGYRLYQRQGPRFIRESGGDTLTRRNTFLLGVDVRYGGQLDLGGYAAVATGLVP